VLTGEVKVPGGGHVPKKAAAAGLVIVGTLVGVYYYKKRKTAAAPGAAGAAATATDQYPPDGSAGNPSDPYSTDPASGATYGNEAAGSGGTLGAFGSGAASGQYYDPATGAYDLASPYGTGGTGVSSGNPQTPGGPPFANNAAWSDWVIQEIQAVNPAADTGALITALGLYLDGQPVSVAQKTLILDAEAIAGSPPVAGTNGYPPKVRTAGLKGPGPHTTEVVPAVKGERAEAAADKITAAHLVAGIPARKSGVAYKVTSTSPAAGRRVPEGSTVHLHIAAEVKPKPKGK
jgi:PASTA domain